MAGSNPLTDDPLDEDPADFVLSVWQFAFRFERRGGRGGAVGQKVTILAF